MELSIVINSYRNPNLLRLCINSVKQNVKNLDYEIIVTDSATEEETEIMMREDYPEVIFFPFRKNVGFQVLVEKGIKMSCGKYILFLNGDIIAKKNSIEKLLFYFKKNPLVGMIGPQLLNFNGTIQFSCFRFYKPITILFRRTFLGSFNFAKKHLDWFLMKDYNHTNPKEVDWLMGSAIMVSREAIKKIGFMDSRFFMYMEDVDWCRRFWEAGYSVVYYPLSQMYHYHGKGSYKKGFFYSLIFNKLTWIHIKSAIKYFKKYWNKPLPQHS